MRKEGEAVLDEGGREGEGRRDKKGNRERGESEVAMERRKKGDGEGEKWEIGESQEGGETEGTREKKNKEKTK